MKCNFKSRMFKGATVLMAAGMIATTSVPAVQAAAPSVMSIVQQAMSMGVAATVVKSGEWCDGITYVLDSDRTLTFTGTGELRSRYWDKTIQVKKLVIGEGITQISMSFENFGLDPTSNQQSIESIELPSQLTAIGNRAFQHAKIKSINIPDSLTSIGDSAFYGCTSLNSINIPDSVTSIGNYTFNKCNSLTSINIPDSVTSIGGNAFNGCTSLTSINIPDSVTFISGNAFSDCTSLTSINIPDSATIISYNAFSGCYNLQYINGGNNVTKISDNAFKVEIQDIPEDKKSQDNKLITYLTTTSDTLKNYNWASDDRTLASTDPSTPSQGESCGTDATFVKSDDGTVTIEGTGKVDDSAFKDQDDVTKVVISEGITEIGNETFKNMDNLETVTLPDSVDKIGDSAFGNDTNLSEVKGGSDTITVADNAFAMDDYSIATQPLVVESKAVYDNIVKKTQRKNVSLKNSGSTTPTTPGTVTPPLTPAAENWSYSDVNNQFETDKFSIPSETADWNIIMNENYNVNGLSEKQGYKSMYSKATSNNEDTVVVCDKASHWMIAIPKDIILDGASAESTADYRVGIAGEVDPAKRVTVTPDQTVTLVNQGNDQITYVATVDQPVTGVNGFDIVENFADAGDTLMNGHISATIKRAGSYKGNMSFAIDYVDYVQG